MNIRLRFRGRNVWQISLPLMTRLTIAHWLEESGNSLAEWVAPELKGRTKDENSVAAE